jgi:hypothetical protein
MKGIALAVVLGLARLASAAPELQLLPGADGHIVVAYEPGLDKIAERVRDVADASLAEIAADLEGLPTPKTIRVQVVRDASELASVSPQNRGAPAYAVGVAYPDLGVLSIAVQRGGQQVDPIGTLQHELAHLALGAAVGERAPRWLHEGFAYQHSPEWSFDRTETLAGMAWFGGIVSYDELATRFPAEELPANRAYAESYDLVGFLALRGREDHGNRRPFRRLLAELSAGQSLDAAAIRAYGKPMRALYDEWREHLSNKFLFAPVGIIGLALWVACAILLAFAWRKRRRQYRTKMAQWEREEELALLLQHIPQPLVPLSTTLPVEPAPPPKPKPPSDDELN